MESSECVQFDQSDPSLWCSGLVSAAPCFWGWFWLFPAVPVRMSLFPEKDDFFVTILGSVLWFWVVLSDFDCFRHCWFVLAKGRMVAWPIRVNFVWCFLVANSVWWVPLYCFFIHWYVHLLEKKDLGIMDDAWQWINILIYLYPIYSATDYQYSTMQVWNKWNYGINHPLHISSFSLMWEEVQQFIKSCPFFCLVSIVVWASNLASYYWHNSGLLYIVFAHLLCLWT